MKNETKKILKKYENYLYTATFAGFIRALTNKEIEELIAAGKELGVNFVNNHCPKCALDFVAKLGRIYYADIELEKAKAARQAAEKKLEAAREKEAKKEESKTSSKKDGKKTQPINKQRKK